MSKRKLLIHIPKNAGSAVKKSLRPYVIDARDHLDPQYRRKLKQKFPGTNNNNKPNFTHCRWMDLTPGAKQSYQAFAIVRNPWDRVVSRYLFREIIRNSKKDTLFKYITFEEFLEERNTIGLQDLFWHRAVDGWFPQYDYVIENKKLRCDIMRYEHLNEDISAYFNKPVNVIWKNVSNGTKINSGESVENRKDYKTFYNKETKQMVADWYKKDIDFFGFTFDSPATKNIWCNNGGKRKI